jgi:hypothetical protein
MRGWWLRTDGVVRHVASRGALGLAVLVTCSTFGACGGASKSRSEPTTGGTGAAGAGGSSVAGAAALGGSSGAVAGTAGAASGTSGAAAGSSGAVSGAAGVVSGAGGQAGGAGGVASGGSSGAGAATGGAAGDSVASAGESSGGAGGECQDLCSEPVPACCTGELRCVERVPRCRIDVLADQVDVIYEYSELQAEIGTLSGGVDVTIPLSVVESAAADPPPAARFQLTLSAEASTDLAALAGVYLRPFRLSCDEQELFVGVVYQREGAAAIQTPVLHAEQAEDGALVLLLGAWQSAWAISGGGAAELRERLDRTELRAELCGRGILDEIQ